MLPLLRRSTQLRTYPNACIRSFSSQFSHRADEKHFDQFYKVQNNNLEGDISGEILDHTVDLSKCRPGDVIDLPYELTVNQSIRDMWQSAFYSHDRVNTSTPFARHLGLQDQVLPFSLMLFLAGSMSHADHAKLQIGFGYGVYHWPAFAGDTFRKRFVIRSLRSTSDGNNTVAHIACEIRNQRDVNLFTCEKHMMFPFHVPSSEVVVPMTEEAKGNTYLNHLISSSEKLSELGSHTLSHLRPGQLIFHTLVRPLSETHIMQLATLARLTHERHFNTRKYRHEEIMVPGGMIFALTCSLASRDLHEVLFEELVDCIYPNNLCPGETVSAMTFIRDLSEHVNGEMEEVDIRTIGVKGLEVHTALAAKNLPRELFGGPIPRPAALEEMLKRTCPELSKKIVCIADRKIYRQSPKQTPFLL
mmetsp:Transcript_16608/g.24995  ORF Transcript_16608/g.24995 Transcript_16608/m.24995 type:complete len:417 (+) Transcript_16608:65-1315(+)